MSNVFKLARGNRARVLVVLACLVLWAGCGDDTASSGADPDPTLPDGSPDPTLPDGGLGGGPYPIADLTVRYTNPDADIDLTYRVSCQGDTATVSGDDVVVSETEACTALARQEVAQRLVDGASPDQVCTQIYGGADLARITGTIDDRPVDTEVSRKDGCAIDDWDSLLADLLPVPVGATPAPPTSDSAPPSDSGAAAILAVQDYIDAVAQGDLERAWGLVAEPSREVLGGFDEFEGLRSALSEGIGAWDSAEDLTVFAAPIERNADGWTVTLIGVVPLEGPPSVAAAAMVVYSDDDRAAVSPFEDAFDSVPFVSFDPPSGSTISADQRIGVELPEGFASVGVTIDGTPVELVDSGSDRPTTSQVVDNEPLTPGLHALTIVVEAEGGERTAVASAYTVS